MSQQLLPGNRNNVLSIKMLLKYLIRVVLFSYKTG